MWLPSSSTVGWVRIAWGSGQGMAKVNKVQKCESHHHRVKVTHHRLSSCLKKAVKDGQCKKKCSKALEKKEWDAATCSVCLEFPHNAVLLLCSSYDKGCRPYMCATSKRFSNCLEQYKNAYTKVASINNASVDNTTVTSGTSSTSDKMEELLCPLCRGQAKGWTVVESARKYLNRKKRTCMQENCSFVGTYKELKRHVKTKHPLSRPRAVDPVREQKWKKFEGERERNDVISTIMSSTPGAIVLGDYVIEPGFRGIYGAEYDSDDSFDDGYLPLESFGRGQNDSRHLRSRLHLDYDFFDEDDSLRPRTSRTAPFGRLRHSRMLGSMGVRRAPRMRGASGARFL